MSDYGASLWRQYFGVPISVIAAVIEAEFVGDKQSAADRLSEGIFLEGACNAPLVEGSSACGNRSFGIGQIRVVRAEGVDEDVRDFFVLTRGIAEGDWSSNRSDIVDRLQNEPMNIVYITAYMAALRDEHPSGTAWSVIYSHKTDIGSYNGRPDMLRQFEASRLFYSYMDH